MSSCPGHRACGPVTTTASPSGSTAQEVCGLADQPSPGQPSHIPLALWSRSGNGKRPCGNGGGAMQIGLCPRWGGAVDWAGRGRRPVWCSRGCRRAAYEERRASASGAIAVRVVEREQVTERVRTQLRELTVQECVQRVLVSPRASRAVRDIHLTGLSWGGGRAVDTAGGLALSPVHGGVLVLVRERCRLFGLPGLVGLARGFRVPGVRASRGVGRR